MKPSLQSATLPRRNRNYARIGLPEKSLTQRLTGGTNKLYFVPLCTLAILREIWSLLQRCDFIQITHGCASTTNSG
jgi:hypothetical protein